MVKEVDVCIIGGGTGGCAAAYAFINKGKRVLLIEKEKQLGGTACLGGVNSWIEAYNTPVIEEIYKELKACGKTRGDFDISWVPKWFTTSKTSKLFFDCKGLSDFYTKKLSDGGIEIWTEASFIKASAAGRVVQSVSVKKGGVEEQVRGKIFIDATTDALLIKSIGKLDVDYEYGRDNPTQYNESIASMSKGKNYLNEPSMIFSIEKGRDDKAILDKITSVYKKDNQVVKPDYLKNTGYVMELNNGVAKINPMYGAGLQGYYRIEKGGEEEKKLLTTRTMEYWKYAKLSDMFSIEQGKCDLQNYGFKEFCEVGVRESYRVKCDIMLTQNDLSKKAQNQSDVVAVGSHTIDFHVKDGFDGAKIEEFNQNKLRPYAIRYGSLIPKNWDNCLIASKCFGASQIAHASARISKVVNQLGWCAGNAALLCIQNKSSNVRKVNLKLLKSSTYTDFDNRFVTFIHKCDKI